MKKIIASATFPEGTGGLEYSSLSDINQQLAGKRILAVEYVNECTVKFVFEDNSSVSLTPSGTEGDDLELSIETTTTVYVNARELKSGGYHVISADSNHDFGKVNSLADINGLVKSSLDDASVVIIVTEQPLSAQSI